MLPSLWRPAAAGCPPGWDGRKNYAYVIPAVHVTGRPSPGSVVRKRLILATGSGLVAAAVLSAAAGYAAHQASVVLVVDGHVQHVRTHARSVADVLKKQHIAVGPHDSVTPATNSRIHDGQTVTVTHGRLLTVTVDGVTRRVWVAANSVADALRYIGIRTAGARLSVNRFARVPLSGMDISINLPHTLSVVVDGRVQSIVTTDDTIGGALQSAGIRLNPDDEVSIPLEERPADGVTVVITRITTGQTTEQVSIPYNTVTTYDSSLYVGTRKVSQLGHNGVLVRTYRVTYANGTERSKQLLSSQVSVPPTPQVVLVGTKPIPVAPAPTYSVKSDGLNWAALARCESGGRPNLVDPPYYGLYQFTLPTWRAVGGRGLPSDASPSEQTYRAQLLYQRSDWRRQWPVCGHYLFS